MSRFQVVGVSEFTRSAARGRPTFDPEERAAERVARKRVRLPPWAKRFTRGRRADAFDRALSEEKRRSGS